VYTKRQQEFLDAATDILAKEGMSRLTIRNVAAAVGVSEPAVYRHFPHKLALLTAMLENLQSTTMIHLARLDPIENESAVVFDRFIRGLFQELENKPAQAILVFSEEAFHTEPQLRPVLLKMIEDTSYKLARFYKNLQDQGLCRTDLPPTNLAETTIGLIRLTITKWHLNPEKIKLTDSVDHLVATMNTLFKAV
jgi:AcrR family transcriptional regulator